MNLPRRVPWASQAELLEVFTLIYPAEQVHSPEDRAYALDIISLWLNRGQLPHAIESTATLVQAELLDHQSAQNASHFGASAQELAVRMAYSMAITRFVNSLVDTYQTGAYAQSIGAIAARIGLPLWFVEIRHAATHEDLPSLEVAREGASAALSWLYKNYWAPTLLEPTSSADGMGAGLDGGESTSESAARATQLSTARATLQPTLRRYKALAKAQARDASRAGPAKAQLGRLLREVREWVTQLDAQLAPTGARSRMVARGRKWTREEMEDARAGRSEGEMEEEDEGASEGLRALVELLLEPGGLIPLSKPKRPRPTTASGPVASLPSTISEVWAPLLDSLRRSFPNAITDELIAQLLQRVCDGVSQALNATPRAVNGSSNGNGNGKGQAENSAEAAQYDRSYLDAAASWLVYLLDEQLASFGADAEDERWDAQEGIVRACLGSGSEQALALLKHLSAQDRALCARLAPLLSYLTATTKQRGGPQEMQDLLSGFDQENNEQGQRTIQSLGEGLQVMERRLETLRDELSQTRADPRSSSRSQQAQAQAQVQAPTELFTSQSISSTPNAHAREIIPGWTRASGTTGGETNGNANANGWKACPLGTVGGVVPLLDLTVFGRA